MRGRPKYPSTICILFAGDYKKGDQPPQGYTEWHRWADVQHRSGLRQKRCKYQRLHFPQEKCRCILGTVKLL